MYGERDRGLGPSPPRAVYYYCFLFRSILFSFGVGVVLCCVVPPEIDFSLDGGHAVSCCCLLLPQIGNRGFPIVFFYIITAAKAAASSKSSSSRC